MPLKRQKHSMPAYIKGTLEQRELMDAYHSRPPYQQKACFSGKIK
jgi:hypothetical protein